MARWKPEEFSAELLRLVDEYDRQGVETECDKLIAHLRTSTKAYPVEAARRDLKSLRRNRYFDLMQRVGDAFLCAGVDGPIVRQLFAQSLLDQGNVMGGAAVLQSVIDDDDYELTIDQEAELLGLVGRAYKQAYVDANDPRPKHNRELLLDAFEVYFKVYEQDKPRFVWHGINAASLLARAERDGFDMDSLPDSEDVAKEIRDAVLARDKAGTAELWDLATLAEAHVALQDWDAAAKVMSRYATDPNADAFELGSTYRQLQELCQLDVDEGTERVLLDLLRGELLKRDGGGFARTPEQVRQELAESENRKKGLEAMLGDDAPQSHSWLMKCLKRANGVARIRFGRQTGTGFLLRGEELTPAWKGRQLLVTNNHVIANEPLLRITMSPKQAEITFDGLHGGGHDQPKYKVKGGTTLFESAIRELDTTIVELDREVEGVEDFPVADTEPFGDARIYVIGHPLGGELSYSFQDNKLIETSNTHLHYRSPTEPGSSGSPLFDDNWQLVGLHHAGGENMTSLDDQDAKHAANEGILFPAIKRAVKKAVQVSA